MRTRIVRLAIALAAAVAASAPAAAGRGIVPTSNKVVVIDDLSRSAIASLSLPVRPRWCAVTPDGRLGLVKSRSIPNDIWLIDLSGLPALASGTNPLPSSVGEGALALGPDGRFLLACRGDLAVTDLTTRSEVGGFPLNPVPSPDVAGCRSVDVCSDGSVLVGLEHPSRLQRLQLDPQGKLSDTGELIPLEPPFFSSDRPLDVACAPGGGSGVVVFGDTLETEIRSFTLPGLATVSVLAAPGDADAEFSRSGDRLFVQGRNPVIPGPNDPNSLQAYAFDPATASVGAPLFGQLPLASTAVHDDPLALSPDGKALYAAQLRFANEPEASSVDVYDAQDGILLASITHPELTLPESVCFPAPGAPQPTPTPTPTVVPTSTPSPKPLPSKKPKKLKKQKKNKAGKVKKAKKTKKAKK